MRRQQIPNAGVFGAQDPGAKSFEAAVFGERITLPECADVGVENPLALAVTVEIEPRDAIRGVPFDFAAVGAAKIERVGGGNIFGGGIGFIDGLKRCAGEPVVAV